MATEAGEETSQGEQERTILQFLDSMDTYLALYECLSSTLRQGWFDLASARYSMGTARISSALFDLKEHQADSTVQVNESTGEEEDLAHRQHFTLVKWGSYESKMDTSYEAVKGEPSKKPVNPNMRFRGAPEPSSVVDNSPVNSDQVQKDRSKLLSVFGTLVSPKLRSTQVSFETALEILVEVANMRTSMLAAFTQLQQKK